VLHAMPISSSLTLSFCLAMSTSYEVQVGNIDLLTHWPIQATVVQKWHLAELSRIALL
jgi:hypothetical protein